jgi:predicted Zn-dependent protease
VRRLPGFLFALATTTWIAWPAARAAAQQVPATVREVRRTFTTYPFSDPDPIPRVGRIYPYFRFDGYTTRPIRREWTVVELENAWLRVSVLPEIGGKIWSAIDKTTGRSLVYDNHVVKFRDIAMRGPWTSGGIEANYGIIGHTPNVATPVDYLTRTNPDGSVSCVVGALDLLTRTPWRLEITLPADKAYFTTSSFWYNATALEQPYYTWMNAAIPASDGLEFIFPGNRFLGHGGEAGDWPVNLQNGKQVSFYRNNDFGGSKSYHVFGVYTDFFGAYWHDQNFGMVRYAPHDEKPGKKLWIWGLSRQGMIWENLLTDASGQYSEIQSGRLFNQSADASTLTPFKHRGFAPHASERWTEYWYPVHGIGGMVAASPWGALNVKTTPAGVVVSFSAAQAVADTLRVLDGDRLVQTRLLTLRPLETFADTLSGGIQAQRLRVTLGQGKLEYDADSTHTTLSRPVAAPPNFDWASAYGHYLLGKERVRERDFQGAEPEFRGALVRDPNFLPALGELAELALRKGSPDEAIGLAQRALAVDTYDPLANYVFGLASWGLGRIADAKDGLDIASQSLEFRSAAWTELAKIYLQQGDPARARQYAGKALDYDRYGLDAHQVRALAARLGGDEATAAADLATIASIDPLSPFVRVERFLREGTAAARAEVLAAIRNEMPHETLLELGIWYQAVGQDRDADQVLSLAAEQPEVLFWRAWLRYRLAGPDAGIWLDRAVQPSPRLVFPFRPETAPVLRWALAQRRAWQTAYYLALVEWNLGNLDSARSLLRGAGTAPAFAPFYAARALLVGDGSPDESLADWQRAMALDSGEWRYGRAVAERLLRDGNAATAVTLVGGYARRFPGNPALGTLYARALMEAGRNAEAAAWLDRLEVLPAEGSAEARSLFREANLLVAVDRLGKRDARAALALTAKARQWPERLGAGKPYAEDVDERLEDWVEAMALFRLGRDAEAEAVLRRIVVFQPASPSSGDLVTILARERLGLKPAGAVVAPDSLGQDTVGRVIRAWWRIRTR